MHPVLGDPFDGAIFTGQGAAKDYKIGQPLRKFHSPVSEVAVKPKANADGGSQPMEEKEYRNGAPGKRKWK